MFIEERHQAILEIIRDKGRVSIAEIQSRFGVSADSARRDLRLLEEGRLLKRTHGGAIALAQVNSRPPRERDMQNIQILPNYDAIAKCAAGMIQAQDTVYLTSGSLGFLMLRHLPRDIPFTLVLNSVTLAEQLKYWDTVEVYLTGGKMRMHGTSSLVDQFAQEFVRGMHFDLCLMTGAGADAAFGLSNNTKETAAFQKAVTEQSRRRVLMMPGQKIGMQAFLRVCGLELFDTLLTDWEATQDELIKIEELGVEITVVREEK